MIDIRFLRENPEVVKQNIRNKFQDHKLPLVDEVIALDEELRAAIKEANDLRASRNSLSKQIGMLMVRQRRTPPSSKRLKLSRHRSRQTPTVLLSWKQRKKSCPKRSARS